LDTVLCLGQWNHIYPSTPSEGYLFCQILQNGVIVAGGRYLINKSTDNGQTWQTVHANRSVVSAVFLNETAAVGAEVVIDSTQNLIRTTDGGSTWVVVREFKNKTSNSYFDVRIRRIRVFNDSIVYAIGVNNVVRSTDAGLSWTDVVINAPGSYCNYYTDVLHVSDNEFFVTAANDYNGEILHTTDGGMSFETTGFLEHVMGITRAGAGDLFAVGYYDYMLLPYENLVVRSTDGGETWIEVVDSLLLSKTSWLSPTSIRFMNENIGWITREIHEKYRTYDLLAPLETRDGGRTWKIMNPTRNGETPYVNSVYVSPEGKILLAGTQFEERYNYRPMLYESNDSGNSWLPLDTAFKHEIQDFAFSGSRLILSGDYGVFARSSDDGQSWQTLWSDCDSSYLDACRIIPVSERKLISIGIGVPKYSTDFGDSWNTASMQGNADSVDRYSGYSYVEGQCIAAVSNDGAKMITTTDHGESWSVVSLPIPSNLDSTDIRSKIWLFPDGKGIVCTSDHGSSAALYVYHSQDMGKSWTLKEKVNQVVANLQYNMQFINSDHGYFVNENELLESTDGGINWKTKCELPPGGRPEGSIAEYRCLFVNDSTGFMYTCDYSIDYRGHTLAKTTDGGKSWSWAYIPCSSIRFMSCKNENEIWAFGYFGLVLHTTNGGVTWVKETDIRSDRTVKLLSCFPNPVTASDPSAIVQYTLGSSNSVYLTLHDIMGREIRTIVKAFRSPGSYTERLDVSGLPHGVYLITMLAGNNPPMVRRMVVR
jgi:photosystem II stability/assembly factor-like uncharacterized protein